MVSDNCLSSSLAKSSPSNAVSVVSGALAVFFACASATNRLFTDSSSARYSFTSATSQNCNFATPCSRFLTLSGLSTPGNSICILPEPCILWMYWDVRTYLPFVLRILNERSMAFSTSVSMILRMSVSEVSREILLCWQRWQIHHLIFDPQPCFC